MSSPSRRWTHLSKSSTRRSAQCSSGDPVRHRKGADMLKKIVDELGDTKVVLMDSISSVEETDSGCVVVSASHGGTSSGEYATRYRLAAAFFNDAGVGKEHAGIESLRMLDDIEVPGGAVSHMSA